MIEHVDDFVDYRIVCASLDRKRALADRGKHEVLAEVFGYSTGMSEPMKSGGGKHDRIVLTVIKLAESRIDIAADGLDHDVGTHCLNLRLTLRLLVPMRARSGSSPKDLIWSRATSASRTSSRSHMALMCKPAGRSVGKSLRL